MAGVLEQADRGEQLKRDGIVIRTYDLWKTYIMGDQEIHAVSGVDIEIHRGEYVAIMGPSGSGKSTLMNLIGCLDTPTKGAVLHQRPPGQRHGRRRAGAHPQQGDRLRLPDLQPAAARHGAAQRRTAADLRRHARRAAPRARQAGPAAGGPRSRACTTSRTSFRAASASASRWRARWSTIPPSCWPTSPPATSTRPPATRSWRCSSGCTSRATPSCW